MTVMTAKEAVGAEIKDRRVAMGYSRRRFSVVFGMTRRQILQVEEGLGNPTVDTLEAYAKALGIDLFELMDCASKRIDRQQEE